MPVRSSLTFPVKRNGDDIESLRGKILRQPVSLGVRINNLDDLGVPN